MAKKTKEKTDYVLLAIVAAVAMVSIVAMYNAKDSTTLMPQPALTGNVVAQSGLSGDSSPSLTGNAVNYPSTTSSYNTPAANTRDFDGDGKVNLNDVLILYDHFNDGLCPAGLDCDLNNDGRLTEDDAKALERSVRSARNLVGQATAFMEDNFDYDNSGRVTLRDKDLLDFYLQTDDCPLHRDCDVDNDGHLTYRDVSSMNIYIKLDELNNQQRTPTVSSEPAATKTVFRAAGLA